MKKVRLISRRTTVRCAAKCLLLKKHKVISGINFGGNYISRIFIVKQSMLVRNEFVLCAASSQKCRNCGAMYNDGINRGCRWFFFTDHCHLKAI